VKPLQERGLEIRCAPAWTVQRGRGGLAGLWSRDLSSAWMASQTSSRWISARIWANSIWGRTTLQA